MEGKPEMSERGGEGFLTHAEEKRLRAELDGRLRAHVNENGHLVLPDCELMHPLVRWIVHAGANRVVADMVEEGVVIRPGMAAG